MEENLNQKPTSESKPFIERYRDTVAGEILDPAEKITLAGLEREVREFEGLADWLKTKSNAEPALLAKWQNDLGRLQASLRFLEQQVQQEKKLRDQYDSLEGDKQSEFANQNRVPRIETLKADEDLIEKARVVIPRTMSALQAYTLENSKARDTSKADDLKKDIESKY